MAPARVEASQYARQERLLGSGQLDFFREIDIWSFWLLGLRRGHGVLVTVIGSPEREHAHRYTTDSLPVYLFLNPLEVEQC